MTKQEEIEKAVRTCIAIEQSCGEFDGNRLTQKILEVEDALGVVIKVKRELPEMPYGRASVLNPVQQNSSNKFRKQGYTKALQAMLRARYVATIPLIERRNDRRR